MERYGDVCPAPPKTKKLKTGDTAAEPLTAYHAFQSKPFGARAVFSAALGGEGSYVELLQKLEANVQTTNVFQSLMCYYFQTCCNKLEKDQIVAGTTAASLLPSFKTFNKFVEKAKELLLAQDPPQEGEGAVQE